MFINHEEVKRIKAKYTPGTRIALVHMDDPHSPVEKGTKGTVSHVDDAGQIHMKWDNGRGLAVNLELDEVEILEQSPNATSGEHERKAAPQILADEISIRIYESDIVSAFDDIGVLPSIDNIEIALKNNLISILDQIATEHVMQEIKVVLSQLQGKGIFKEEPSDG